MEKLDSALFLRIVLYTNYFNFKFSYLHTFYKPSNIKTKPSTKFKTYIQIYHNNGTDKCSTLDSHGAQRMKKGWKVFHHQRCYTIALKFWDEFNANFVSLYFSSYSSIKMWHLCLKNMEKNNKAVPLRFVLTYLF